MSGWPGGLPPLTDAPGRVDEDGTVWMKFHDGNADQTMWIQNLVRTWNEKDDKIDKLASENFELKKRLAVRIDLEVQAAAVAYITSLATTERLLVALQEVVAKMAETKEPPASQPGDEDAK